MPVRENLTRHILYSLAAVIVAVLMLTGCSIKRVLVISSAKTLLYGSIDALLSENDLVFARASLESDLKLLEGLINVSPNDPELLVLAAQGYAGYALVYIEENDPARAIDFYKRARGYGLRALALKDERFSNPEQPLAQFESCIKALDEEDLAAAYWTGMAWGSAINLQLTSPAALTGFPKAKALMEWIAITDSSYYHYGAFWFLGTFYSSLPPMMGGDINKSRRYFTRADSLCRGEFLMGKVLYARGYAVQTMDKGLFIKLINEVQTRDNTPHPTNDRSLILVNQAAKLRAEQLLKQIDELF